MKSITKNCYICQYNEENLKKVLKNDFITLKDIGERKRHFIYLLEYLGSGNQNSNPGLDAGMILVEKKYTSRSYLEDYRDHYFMSYKVPSRDCERIHFFTHKLEVDIIDNKEEQKKLFEILLSGSPLADRIWNGYLGHIVKRPIPNGIIGATLLKTYPVENKTGGYTRKYTVRKNYKINLLGKERILKTLIYLEQDRIVGACATSALYVAFHRLSHLFDTSKPNQKKISDAAGISVRTPNRKLKNKEGLTPFQICKVIEKFGLDPEIHSLSKNQTEEIKSMLYAYLKMGIPVILGFKFDQAPLQHKDDKKNDDNDNHHAITMTGYAETVDKDIKHISYLSKSKLHKYISKNSKTNLPIILKSKDIKQFYAHDDQIGPFSRVSFDSGTNKIITSWWDVKKGVSHKLLATPFVAIVPLIDRIRMPYEAAIENVKIVNTWLHMIVDQLNYIKWDIYLSRSNKEKKYILNSAEYNHKLHSDALSESYPKYVWVADCYHKDSKWFKVIFDASDINDKHFGWDIIYYNKDIKQILVEYFEEANYSKGIEEKEQYITEVIETAGIETTNLFRKSLKLKPLKV